MGHVDSPSSSLFDFVNELDSHRAFTNTTRSLRIISHEIEDAVVTSKIRTHVFAGFQYMRLFMPQIKRYQRLAQVAETIWVFGVPDTEPPPIDNVIYVPLSSTDRLAEEWFLVVDSLEYFSALIAHELTEGGTQSSERRYRGIWTFDPNSIQQADHWLSRRVGAVKADSDLTGRNFSQQLHQIGHTVENLVNDLELRNAELERTQALTRTLTDMIVHDINNPLTVVQSDLHLINLALTRGKPETITRYAQNAMESSQQALNLIKDLLEVSRMEAGELKLDLKPAEVSKIVGSVITGFTGMAEIQKKHLTADINPQLWVDGDQGMLVRVLTNLVGNAFKFTLADGSIHIWAKPSQDAKAVIIGVTDDGPGVSKENQQRIFEKFGQVKGQGNERHGFGLGLTFCRMCVEAHGGQISVHSEEGKGATFQFTLRAISKETNSAKDISTEASRIFTSYT